MDRLRLLTLLCVALATFVLYHVTVVSDVPRDARTASDAFASAHLGPIP